MSQTKEDYLLRNVAEPLTVRFAYKNADRHLIWFQVNRTPEEVAEYVLALRLLYGFDPGHFSMGRSGNEAVIGLRVLDNLTPSEFPELFGRVAQTLATCLCAPFNLTFLYKDMSLGTMPMRLPAFARQFGLTELLEDLRADQELTLIDELEATFTDAMANDATGN